MSVPSRWLDCAPLDLPIEAPLSAADLRRVEPLQRALLSPLDHETVDDWRRAVNRAMIAAFDADAAMFQLEADGVSLQFSDEFDTTDMVRYTDDFMATLSRDRHLYRRMSEIGAGNRSMLWAADLEWLYRSEYFNELIVRMRAFDPLWVSASAGPAAYPAVLHTYHDRRRSSHFFDATDVGLMRLMRPALDAGVQTIVRAAASRAALTASLDGQRDGALVYDLDGRLLHRNPALRALAATELDEGALMEAGREMAVGLDGGATQDVLAPPTVSRSVITRAGEYDLYAVRVREGGFALRPAVLVTVVAGPPPLPDRNTLRRHFGLTPRQSEVALLLALRKTDPEIAEMLCISPHTARHHAEAVMGKLRVHDRREIEAMLREGGAE